jgi:hypothetical protein
MEEQMNRNILAIATALLAAPAFFASAAQACISCNYTPEVVKGHLTSDAPAHYARERAYTVERVARPAKRIVKSEPVAKTVDTAETVETAPVKKIAKNENSSISLASTEAAAPAKAAVVENTKEAAAKPVDCKKFFPSVGITLSVPCE